MMRHTRMRIFGLALGFTLFAALAYAQNPPPAPTPPAPNPQAQPNPPAPNPPAQPNPPAPNPTAQPNPSAANPAVQNPTSGNAASNVTMKGKIVRIQGNDQFIVQTPDNKEMTFYANPNTRYMVNGKAAQFSDLRVGTEINAAYITQGDRYIANSVTVGEVPAQPVQTEPVTVQGSIVRVVGDNQVIVKTADGKEVIVYVEPQTVYTWNEQPARFTDLRPGAEVHIDYDVRDRRNTARSIRGLLPRNR